MSMTESIGVVTAAHWSYTAKCMVTHLEKVGTKGSTLPNELQKGVYANAKRFFTSALANVNNYNPPRGQLATLADYKTAVDALCSSTAERFMGNKQVEDRLKVFEVLLTELEIPKSFTADELILLGKLRAFFRSMVRLGEEGSRVPEFM